MMNRYILNDKYDQLKDFLLNIKTYFYENPNTIHKARNELKIIAYDGVDTIVKSFKVPNFINRIVYTFFRDSKAKKSYTYALKIGDFTPTPIGYIEFYSFGLLENSYFVAEKFTYDFTIKEVITNQTLENRDIIFKEFAKFTYDLHEHNILHHDYSPGNILIKQNKDKYTFKIVDINRMNFKSLSLQERLNNFSKLWLLDDDLIIIVKEYAKLVHADEVKCIKSALQYSHALKRKKNFKKRLKGIPVVD